MSNAKVIVVGGGLSGLSAWYVSCLLSESIVDASKEPVMVRSALMSSHTVLERGGNVVCTLFRVAPSLPLDACSDSVQIRSEPDHSYDMVGYKTDTDL